ncbi:hypothetical protein GXP67_06490 [Rhodocytophaga rosea]|uniref:Uncharacterized protein n=1 Tax=Rhodocytophaga rosea TaxID=2704465 RepID=A0A6C0GF89_9BACT|nr:hypothetical protein [Rhodocytophaga rosea]QHT66330.1 hypothetical protein GXP67_06490 [Rhodocytophaga rosea]
MSKMNNVTSLKEVPALESYTIARGINGILWIWEKVEDNVWKVYAYETPQNYHFEDDKGNQVNR